MNSKRIAQTNQQQKTEKPQGSGILQRAAVRSVSDAEMQSTADKEAHSLSNSAFSKDFSRVPINTTKPQPIMAKLMVGPVGDKYEQEADRVAAQVVQRINASVPVRPGEDESVQQEEMETKDNEARLMRSPIVQRKSSDGGMPATSDLEVSINQARGGGRPMENNVRKQMEQGFAADFSGVKIHTDAQSDHLNRSIQARAFTTRQNVFFRQGEYNPGSRRGQELLAHELTHVVQQSGGAVQRKSQKEITEQTKPYTVISLNSQVVQRGNNTSKIASAANKVGKKTYRQGQITNTVLANILKTRTTGQYVTHGTNQVRNELTGATEVTERTNPGTTGDRVHFMFSLENFMYGKIIYLGNKEKLGGQNAANGDYIVFGRVPISKLEGFYLKEQYHAVKDAIKDKREPEEV